MKSTLAVMIVAGTAVLGGCSTTPTSYSSPSYSSYDTSSATMYGTIDSITVTRGSGSSGAAGAVVGGVVGGLLGNQVGSGSGRTAATAAGAIAGAMVGKEVQENRAGDRDMYQVSIRMDNGDYRTVVQDSVYDLRVGNRVRVVDGRAYRY
ncbi:MAG TPA: glycine zipper 2TM domain-containing protein [Telluria sp.]|nr:glycine zipper 2TM domain-containing protein [Telluria sp.]